MYILASVIFCLLNTQLCPQKIYKTHPFKQMAHNSIVKIKLLNFKFQKSDGFQRRGYVACSFSTVNLKIFSMKCVLFNKKNVNFSSALE